MIYLKHCTIEYTPAGCTTRFNDGTSVDAIPHDTHHYAVIAHRLGYGDDVMAYCREHEVCHSLVAEWLAGDVSNVLYALAQDFRLGIDTVVYEEAMAQLLQRFIRANERPIISGVRWDELKAYALEKLDGEK